MGPFESFIPACSHSSAVEESLVTGIPGRPLGPVFRVVQVLAFQASPCWKLRDHVCFSFLFCPSGTFVQVPRVRREGSPVRVSTEYAAQVAAGGPGVLGKPRRATGPEAGSPDPGAARTGPSGTHPGAQPDSLQGRGPVNPTLPRGALASLVGGSQRDLIGRAPVLMATRPWVRPS